MPLIYLTGASGSGKSTVSAELIRCGFESHDLDNGCLADWVDRQSGVRVPFPHDEAAVDRHDWYRRHRWVINQGQVGKLKEHSEKAGQPVFVCGVADGEEAVRHLFDKVIILTVDEATLRQRLAARQNNHFGKDPEELAEILEWLARQEATPHFPDTVRVDARQPLGKVVEAVIAAANAKVGD